jgi:hypothetical protein
MPAPTNRLAHFISKYHLWSVVILLSLLGVRESLSIAIWSYYDLRMEIDEASYSYKERHIENQRRYDQLTRNDERH